jgi:hypothetical protein
MAMGTDDLVTIFATERRFAAGGGWPKHKCFDHVSKKLGVWRWLKPIVIPI